jgi:hypothetical protein
MKKYKVSIDGGAEQIVCASSGDLAALRCRLRDAFNQKLKTGESQRVTVTVTRLPYTKDDDEARRGPRPAPETAPEPKPDWKPKVGDLVITDEGFPAQVTHISGGDVQLRLVAKVGDILVTEEGKLYGVVAGLNSDGSYRADLSGTEFEESGLPEGTKIFNPALGARRAKFAYDDHKAGQRLSCHDELTALGLA